MREREIGKVACETESVLCGIVSWDNGTVLGDAITCLTSYY